VKEILEYIENKSTDMLEMGVFNFALLKNDALVLIEKFKNSNILVYGGSFITKENGKLNYNYTNWSMDTTDIIYNLEYSKNFIEKYAQEDMYISFTTDVDLYKLIKEKNGIDYFIM